MAMFVEEHEDIICKDSKALIFVLSGFISFIFCFLAILLSRLVRFLCCRRAAPMKEDAQNVEHVLEMDSAGGELQPSWYSLMHLWAAELIGAQTLLGRVLLITVFALSVASFALYLYETQKTATFEICVPWSSDVLFLVDFIFNVFFMVYFALKFIAANDKLWFIVEPYAIVDFMTIPPSLVSIYLERHWVCLRFFRAMRLMMLPEVLTYLDLMKYMPGASKLIKLVGVSGSFWLTSAGFVHLVENFQYFEPKQNLSYFQCFYFLTVTMTTVGFGDVTTQTTIGTVFIIPFIIVFIVIFTSSIPEIEAVYRNMGKEQNKILKEEGKRHVVLCGNITFESLQRFLYDFLHPDRSTNTMDLKIALLTTITPDLEMSAFIKKNRTRLDFFRGSVMEGKSLELVRMEDADACLVIANSQTASPDTEDAENIMRVISIKNYCPEARVIVQILKYENKAFLTNIPCWDWKIGDDAVCVSEIELGLIAQSCLAQGFSTLMANLLIMGSDDTTPDMAQWQLDYIRGAGMEIYTEYFSRSFYGLNFQEAAELCYTRLNLVLLAIEIKPDRQSESFISISPNPSVKVEPEMQGFFIAESAEQVRNILYFCTKCHEDLDLLEEELTQKCKCPDSNYFQKIKSEILINTKDITSSKTEISKVLNPEQDDPVESFDFTGLFHYCPSKTMKSCILSQPVRSSFDFKNHIVICLFAEPQNDMLGLISIVMPLRASNLAYNELKDIVFVGNLGYLHKEWASLENFPKLFILPGSPSNRANLRVVDVHRCDLCIILSTDSYHDDMQLIDKDIIICSLSVHSMNFHTPRASEASSSRMKDDEPFDINDIIEAKNSKFKVCQVPLLLELKNDTSVQFIDFMQKDYIFSRTPSFACGSVFAVTVLDSLMCTSYYSYNTLSLVRNLITGGTTPDLEMVLAEGYGMQKAQKGSLCDRRFRSRVAQFPVSSGPLETHGTYSDLYLHAIKNYNMICLGLYRRMDANKIQQSVVSKKAKRRYVITNPAPDFELIGSDYVFVIISGHSSWLKEVLENPATT